MTGTFWDLGVIIGPSIAIVVTGLLVWFALYARKRQAIETARNYRYSDEVEWRFCKRAAVVVVAIVIVATLASNFPYEARFHQWRTVAGDVQSVDVRRLDGMYLVVIEGRPYKVTDTRAAGLRAGDPITLVCIDRWQYAGVSGTECNWGSR